MKKISYLALGAIAIVGCGGGGSSAGDPGSGQTLTVGPVVTNVEGAVQRPLITSGNNLVVMGVYGGSITDMKVKMPPMSTLSPDEVASASMISFCRRARAHLYQPGTGEVTPVGSFPSTPVADCYTDISPDGMRVVTTEYVGTPGPTYQIFTENLDGSNRIQLTSSNTIINAIPKYSPDGSKIVFVRYATDFLSTKIMVMNVDGTNQTIIGNVGKFDVFPTWSEDGSKISYIQQEGTLRELWTMNSDGSNKTKLLGDANLNILDADWSPVGGDFAVTWQDSINKYHVGLYNMTTLTSYYSSDNQIYTVSFSPDGQKLCADISTIDNNHQLAILDRRVGEPTIGFSQSDYVIGQWGPYLTEKKFIGTGGPPFGTSMGGFLFGLQGRLATSIVAFDSPTRTGIVVNKQDDSTPDQPDLVVTIDTADKLNNLQYVNSIAAPPVKVILPGTGSTHASGAAVAFDAETGHIAAIITYTASASMQAVTRSKGKVTVKAKILGIWDENGKNIAPSGGTEAVIDSVHGKLLSHR